MSISFLKSILRQHLLQHMVVRSLHHLFMVKCMLQLDPKQEIINESTKKKIENDLKKYTVASIQPEVIDPTSFYMIPKTYAYYNGNDTNLTGSQLGTKILQSIDDFNRAGQSNRFGGRLETSKFGAMVDNADTAISGNVTQMALGQNLDKFTFGNVFTQCLDFGNPIYDPNDYSGNSDGNGGNGGDGDGDGTGDNGDGNGNGDGTGGKCNPSFSTVKSGTFYATGYTEDLVNLTASGGGAAVSNDTVFSSNEENQVLVPVNIRDDGKGNLMLVTTRDESEVILNATVGTVDYVQDKFVLVLLLFSKHRVVV